MNVHSFFDWESIGNRRECHVFSFLDSEGALDPAGRISITFARRSDRISAHFAAFPCKFVLSGKACRLQYLHVERSGLWDRKPCRRAAGWASDTLQELTRGDFEVFLRAPETREPLRRIRKR